MLGKHFLNLDMGLPVDQLRYPVRACLLGKQVVEHLSLPATNRRGRSITCQITCTPLTGSSQEIQGVIIVMEEAQDFQAKR